MKSIYKNNKIALNQVNHHTYNLLFDDDFKIFLNFYKKNLNLNKKKGIEFKADKVISLSDLLKENDYELNYNLCNLLFLNLSKQLKILLNNNITPLTLINKDIYFIESGEKKIFLYLNLDYIFESNNDIIEIKMPFRQDKFFSPELKLVKSFPVTITNKTIYYTLALCVCNCLHKFSEKIKHDYDFKNHIEMIKETKLYWALLRCLEKEPKNRFCLYI